MIQKIPEVNENGDTDCKDRENAVDFGPPSTGHEGSRKNQPDPPFCREFPITELLEPYVGIYGERHEEDKCSVKEDKTRLCDVGIVWTLMRINGSTKWMITDRRE